MFLSLRERNDSRDFYGKHFLIYTDFLVIFILLGQGYSNHMRWCGPQIPHPHDLVTIRWNHTHPTQRHLNEYVLVRVLNFFVVLLVISRVSGKTRSKTRKVILVVTIFSIRKLTMVVAKIQFLSIESLKLISPDKSIDSPQPFILILVFWSIKV